MFDAVAIQGLPEVLSVVVGDREGSLLDSLEEADAETTAAIAGFAASHLVEAGAILGLGDLERITLLGGGGTTILYLGDEAVLTARVDPRQPVASLEARLEALFAQGERP